MHVNQREPEQAGAFHVICGPRFGLLGGSHQARISIRGSNRGDLDIKSELPQETHFAQHENVVDGRILTQ
jgi:hypothetical protein